MIKQFFMINLIAMLVLLCGIAQAQEKSADLFDKRLTYNIYFNSGYEDSSVIEDIEIIGFEVIGSKSFLIIRSKGLTLSEENGYILFDSISAILPDRNFRVKGLGGLNKKVKY